ncbi:two-component regulator propeller domain-containing protein [Leeuwenhoekiella polynyae]|uniref:histidine kinase n=1 Tax=Leeuwenhoekiella polynyae TaxID=1550906 RepID=A0A4Q0PES5_9FLAO|nr:two-component regulator propeller domain-containing protein [Leeuwenhoekiella polynyae]RXG25375.1 signal transduction histidine kinase [Leeuwenhoekiella polynyae]
MRYFFSILLVFCFYVMPAQTLTKPAESIDDQLIFYNFDLSSGISNSYINSIEQDEFGFIWIGTIDGLNRYDGSDFKIYRHRAADSTSLFNNYIESLKNTDSEDLLILTDAGIDIYNDETDSFQNVHLLNNVTDNVSALAKRQKGGYFVGYYSEGVRIFDENNKMIASYRNRKEDPSSLSYNEVSSLLSQGDSILWVGTFRKGLNRIDLKKNTVNRLWFDKQSLADEQPGVRALHLDKAGNLWIGSQNGLFVLKTDGSFRTLGTGGPNALSDTEILSFAEDNQGRMWIGTRNGGLNILKIDSFLNKSAVPEITQFLPRKDGSSVYNRTVSALKLDRGGNMWIGTSNGLNFVNPQGEPIKLIDGESSVWGLLSHMRIGSLATSKTGNVFIGTDGGGIDLYHAKSGKITPFAVTGKGEKGLSNDYVISLLEDSKKRLWAGTYKGGLNKLENDIWSHYLQGDQVDGNDVRTIFEDSQHRIWVGTNRGGLYKYDDKNDIFEYVEILGKLDVRAIDEDSKGNLWMATYSDGILKYNPVIKVVTKYDSRILKGLPSDIFFSLVLVSDDELLAGSRFGGLVKFNIKDQSFSVINEQNGLPNTTINSIVPYNSEEVWISTNYGLSSYNFKTNEVSNLLNQSSIQKGEFNIGAAIRDQKGNLWFGGNKGLNVFNPDNLYGEGTVYGILFKDLKINNESVAVKPGGAHAILSKTLNDIETLKLTYKENLFSIDFALIKYPFSQDVVYSYRLEGYNDNWVDLSTNNRINFTNIPAGKYNLIIKAMEQSGHVVQKELPIIITPPFWLTWPAYILYMLLAILFIYAISIYYSERVKLKNSLVFEKKQRQLEHDFNEERLRFFSGFSHELKTPLTLILAPLDILAGELKSSRHHARIDLIKRNASDLLVSINRLLDFRKTEEGLSKLYIQHYDLVNTLKYWTSLHKNAADVKKIDLQFETEFDELQVVNDVDKLQIILNNLISNALKYTLEGGEVTVILKANSDNYSITVSDSGVGIHEEEFEHIFNWFYHSNSSVKRSGSGIGLSLSKRFAELHAGTLTVKSKEGEGSTFTLELPFDLAEVPREQIDKASDSDTVNEQIEKPFVAHSEPTSRVKKALLNGEKQRELILLVEDNEDILIVLDDILSEEYDLIHAVNGEEGAQMATKFIPDLIITDVMMPVKDGIDMCHELKLNKETSHIPVIMLSAKNNTAVKVSGYKEGADDYLTKPFEPALIRARVRNLLDSRNMLKLYFNQNSDQNTLSTSESRVLDKEKEFLADFEKAVLKFKDAEGSIIAKLTKNMGMSRTSLYKKITVLTGENINSYVRIIKVNKAAQLMREEGYSVSQAATEVGFSSPKYFRKIFKEQFGKLPSEVTTSFNKLL